MRLIASALLLLTASGATACPLCDSPTAERVRAEFAGRNVVTPALALGLPFLACLAVAALVRFLPRREDRRCPPTDAR